MSHERRVFLELSPGDGPGEEVTLSAVDAHHLRTVIRLEPGDPVTVVDRKTAKEYLSFVTSVDEPFLVKLGNEAASERSISSVRGLLFALCKNKTNDFVAEKATELGVEFMIFWEGTRSIVKLKDDNEAEKKSERLSKIATEASKQSGRNTVPEVYVAHSLQEALTILGSKTLEGDRYFFGSLLPESLPFSKLPPLGGFAHILIGPEGDITREEEGLVLDAGFEAFTLGANRLRAETAACAAIAAVDIFGEMSKRGGGE